MNRISIGFAVTAVLLEKHQNSQDLVFTETEIRQWSEKAERLTGKACVNTFRPGHISQRLSCVKFKGILCHVDFQTWRLDRETLDQNYTGDLRQQLLDLLDPALNLDMDVLDLALQRGIAT